MTQTDGTRPFSSPGYPGSEEKGLGPRLGPGHARLKQNLTNMNGFRAPFLSRNSRLSVCLANGDRHTTERCVLCLSATKGTKLYSKIQRETRQGVIEELTRINEDLELVRENTRHIETETEKCMTKTEGHACTRI